MGGKEYSEATAARLDDEVRTLIMERVALTQEMLSKNRGLFDEIAGELLNKEEVESDEFYRLVDARRTPDPLPST